MFTSTPIVYNRDKNDIFKIVDTYLTFLKDKIEKKE
jgi:hypothetical protein